MDLFNSLQNLTLAITATISGLLMAGSVQTTTIASPSPTITPNPNIITKTGEYNYGGQNLKYTLSIPRNGGAITGNIEGACKGPVTGNFEGSEGGEIAGKANVVCSFGFIKKNIDVTYLGNLFLKEGKADLSWEGQVPLTDNKGELTLKF